MSVLNGDVNNDNIINIQDVIIIVNVILGTTDIANCEDFNADGLINIQDVILIVNQILE